MGFYHEMLGRGVGVGLAGLRNAFRTVPSEFGGSVHDRSNLGHAEEVVSDTTGAGFDCGGIEGGRVPLMEGHEFSFFGGGHNL